MSSSTYVFVPGAGGEAHYWDLVVERLEAAGHSALAVDLPADDEALGLADYADLVVEAARGRGPVTVVAHSMGALSAPLVSNRLEVEELVLVAPMIPVPGETGGGWWESSGQTVASREHELREGRDPDAPFDDMAAFFHDVEPDVVEAMLARGSRDQASRPFAEPWPLDAWPDVPTRVIGGRLDRLMPLEFLRRLTRERLGADVPFQVVDAGHMPMIAAPDELTAALLARRGAPVG